MMRILALKQLHKNVLKTRAFNTSCKNDNSCETCLDKKYKMYTTVTKYICIASGVIAFFRGHTRNYYEIKKDKDIINIDDIIKP